MKIVMLADDSPVIRKVGKRIIEGLGFVVVEAADAEEAIARARDATPDVALIDWDMPGMNGSDLVRELRALPETADMKIVYCTSSLIVPEMTKAKRAGAQGFLMKPFNRKLLIDKFSEIGIPPQVGRAA